jgi:hypothetical protein
MNTANVRLNTYLQAVVIAAWVRKSMFWTSVILCGVCLGYSTTPGEKLGL